MKTLVFLEHHEGKLQQDSLGVLGKAVTLGGESKGSRPRPASTAPRACTWPTMCSWPRRCRSRG